MVGAFVYLTLCSVRNRLRARLRRLRQPRYLVGALVGVLWVGSTLLRPLLQRPRSGRPIPSPLEMVMTSAETARFGIALALFVVALLIALWPGRRRPLEFSPAEVQFLFPAPITRRQLLHYKLVRSQGGLLFGAVIATLLLRPGAFRGGWTFPVGLWLVLAVYRLYAIGVGLAAGGLRRSRAMAAISVAAVAVLGIAAAPAAGQLAAMTGVSERLEALARLWSSGAPRIVLWPFATLVSLPLAGSPAAFWSALPGVLLLAAFLYARVIRADAAFEEASAAHAEKRATAPARAPRVRRRGSPAPFPLALVGRPETAILWKNLILLGRYASLATLLRLLPLFLVFGLAMSRGKNAGVATLLFTVSSTAVFILAVMGPGIMRNDLRQDLGRLAVLKSWPVSGAAIVRGELLAPAIVLSLALWLLVAVAALAVGSVAGHGRLGAVLLPHRVSYAVAAMLVAPAVVLAGLVVQNGLAVLFPAWMTPGRSRVRGIEGMGQGMLVVWGGLVASAVLLAPPAAGAALVTLAIAAATHARAVVVPAAVLLALAVAECLLLTRWLGRVLERSDLSAVDPAE